jgi:glyceraldehyde-3-phosphate dehydrogenase/erythrose-4-phosphate dehydrogenase
MSIRVAINGFGRTGRTFLRSAHERDADIKVIAWYDNEWGYSSRLVDLAERVLVPVGAGASGGRS